MSLQVVPLVLLEEVGVYDGLVTELVHNGSFEASQTDTAMNEELVRVFSE